MNVTENELLDALREALRPNDDPSATFSVDEMRDALGVRCPKRVRNALRKMIEDGTAEPVRVRMRNLAGVEGSCVRYRLKE